ncbi:MAG: DsrE family protein [Gammaproteobacteria bacterium]|nr:DsrE family protein [Gammaproteobacteria bacterium]MDH5799891.1 DsrE family protein [Gammaproteobacteria bacterium]
MKYKGVLLSSVLLGAAMFSFGAVAGEDCPVGLVSGMTLDDEFGPGTQALTRCLQKTKKVKVVYQIHNTCKDSGCTAPYALGNIKNAIKDYEITHGLDKDDYQIVAIVHSGGTGLVLNNNAANPNAISNPFQKAMEDVIGLGVKVYYCQNTARKKGVKTDQLIEGVGYVTAGVTAIADLQLKGFAYVQP